MSTKREITKKYAREYGAASMKSRGRMLDELVATNVDDARKVGDCAAVLAYFSAVADTRAGRARTLAGR